MCRRTPGAAVAPERATRCSVRSVRPFRPRHRRLCVRVCCVSGCVYAKKRDNYTYNEFNETNVFAVYVGKSTRRRFNFDDFAALRPTRRRMFINVSCRMCSFFSFFSLLLCMRVVVCVFK